MDGRIQSRVVRSNEILTEVALPPQRPNARVSFDGLEVQAVERASVYEDAEPALAEPGALGVKLVVASSLSEAAVGRFLERCSVRDRFAGCWSRDAAGGVNSVPLARTLAAGALAPDRVRARGVYRRPVTHHREAPS